jgi:hypothetical protein
VRHDLLAVRDRAATARVTLNEAETLEKEPDALIVQRGEAVAETLTQRAQPGLIGLATALKLLTRYPSARVTVLEKEAGVARHQSTHNSGVLHCGLYYKPGSLKARLAVEGVREMTAFCRAHDIPHEICGKLVVATSEAELPRLDQLLRRGAANGLAGLRRIERDEIRRIEPHDAEPPPKEVFYLLHASGRPEHDVAGVAAGAPPGGGLEPRLVARVSAAVNGRGATAGGATSRSKAYSSAAGVPAP